jgi:hypothetical protein
LRKVLPFPNRTPRCEDAADPLQQAEKAVEFAQDLVRRSKNRITREIDAALDNLDSQLKLVGDIIDCIPDAAARERLASHHAVLTAAGRELRHKKDALRLGDAALEGRSKTDSSD